MPKYNINRYSLFAIFKTIQNKQTFLEILANILLKRNNF